MSAVLDKYHRTMKCPRCGKDVLFLLCTDPRNRNVRSIVRCTICGFDGIATMGGEVVPLEKPELCRSRG
jgi:predicted RNA-binding Zn-ribbon protein involved in translation (DUF1610 family)